MFQVKHCHPRAQTPQRQSLGAAGYDLYSCDEVCIRSGERMLVDTGVKIKIDPGYYARIAPRSGLSLKGIDVGAGVVDSDYRGLVKVLVINNSDKFFHIYEGDRIAQIILERIATPEITVVEQFNDDDTVTNARGERGFGSTGIN